MNFQISKSIKRTLKKQRNYANINMSRKLAYNKKEEHLNSVNVTSKIWVDTLLKSVYFFIANTSKVRSNKMIHVYLKTFIIKVLILIYIYLPSKKEIEATLKINVSKALYTI